MLGFPPIPRRPTPPEDGEAVYCKYIEYIHSSLATKPAAHNPKSHSPHLQRRAQTKQEETQPYEAGSFEFEHNLPAKPHTPPPFPKINSTIHPILPCRPRSPLTLPAPPPPPTSSSPSRSFPPSSSSAMPAFPPDLMPIYPPGPPPPPPPPSLSALLPRKGSSSVVKRGCSG